MRDNAPQNMRENRSIWIETLKRQRKAVALKGVAEADVLIIGGGIAGASTLFYLLRETDKSVVLVDSHLVGHGASGHNAGQLYGGFEEHISGRIKRFGLDAALAGERMLEKGWDMLDDMYQAVGSQTPKKLFLAYGGYSKLSLIVSNLEGYCYYYDQAGVPFEQFLIAEESGVYDEIPPEFKRYCRLVPHQDILDLLETKERRYVAAFPLRSGTISSAQLCEDVVSYCLRHYPDRCKVFENSPVHEVIAGKDGVKAKGFGFVAKAKEIVLCTNGFDRFKIVNTAGEEIDTSFHHKLHGLVNYMGAYGTSSGRTPTVHWYHEPDQTASALGSEEDMYFYLSRNESNESGEESPAKAAFRQKAASSRRMVLGGPERLLEYRERYDRNAPISDEILKEFDGFINRALPEGDRPVGQNFWHGIMGYTPSGVRIVGREPKNARILYNLGCNGIGIIQSVFGAGKIARHINGEAMPRTIFDPR